MKKNNEEKLFSSPFKNNNVVLILATSILVIFGCLMVYSASYYFAELNYGNKYYFLTKQIIGVVLGFFAFFFFSSFNYSKIKKFSTILLIISFILLSIVFIPFIGVTNYGATRWINLGFFTFQPSEIAKFAFVIWCSNYISKKYKDTDKPLGILPMLFVGGIMCILIMLEPNMSITICVGLVMVFMIFIGGIKKRYLFILLGLIVALIPMLIIIEPYRMKRLVAFLNPWENPLDEGFQLIQSLYSLGAGGLFGVGLFNSRQKYLFLPFSESDFIFAIIGEEFGLFGVTLLMLVYIVIIWQGIKIALNCKERFGSFMASGIIAIIAVQVLVNIAVVTGSIPPTGVPLPFISAGSTSIIVFMAGVGILNSIYKMNKNNQFLFNER